MNAEQQKGRNNNEQVGDKSATGHREFIESLI
jgi:hypothetical protein